MDLGEKLKQYRQEKGLTQIQLAEILDIEPTLLSKFENGRKPQGSTLLRINKLFNEDTKDSKILNIAFNKSGNGGLNARIQIPVMWLDVLGLDKDSKAVLLNLENNQIILKTLGANVGDAVEIEFKDGHFRHGEIKKISKTEIELDILNTLKPVVEVIPVIDIKNIIVLDEFEPDEDDYMTEEYEE